MIQSVALLVRVTAIVDLGNWRISWALVLPVAPHPVVKLGHEIRFDLLAIFLDKLRELAPNSRS